MEIEWTDTDPASGEKRYVCAEKFARQWRFKVRFKRRTEWDRGVVATREMWETLLEAMERRYRRREGVTDEDLAEVRKVIAGFGAAVPFTPILATLGYVFSPDRSRVLMIHRNARPEDPHYGKYNGLGGKLDGAEDIVSGMRREVREEAGIECEALNLAGTISWPGFGKGGEDWFGFLFRIERFAGEPVSRNPEGTLEWVETSRLLELPLWEGDRHFLPLILDRSRPQFHGVMPYRSGRPLSWGVNQL